MEAQVDTGHRLEVDLWRLMVWNLDLFFWASNVMETISADARLGWSWLRSLESLKNRMLLSVSSLVVVDSLGLVVLLYSQDLIAKKKAPTINWEHANDKESLLSEYSWATLFITDKGTAFCRVSFGSWAL